MLRLILKEIMHRKINAALILLAITGAVALFVGFTTMGAAADRETTRLMRNLGFNLRIIPKATDEAAFWALGYAKETMPADYVARFSQEKGISYRHLIATLQRQVAVGSQTVLLTGIAAEVNPADAQKERMGFEIAPGSVYLGSLVARALEVAPGDTAEILGRRFNVAQVLPDRGSAEDIRVYMELGDAQALLEAPGQINEIQALECLCRSPEIPSLSYLRDELARIMPEAKVVRMNALAEAREQQRIMVERYFRLALELVLCVCAIWIAALAMLNVRDRRPEIGLLRALGYGSGAISALFLGKALLLGLAGAGLGFAAGTLLALEVGPEIFHVTAKTIQPMYFLLWVALAAAPLFAALSSLVPTALAVTQDPAAVLRDE